MFIVINELKSKEIFCKILKYDYFLSIHIYLLNLNVL